MFAERWTIDEVGDGMVRVLAARSGYPEKIAHIWRNSTPNGNPTEEDFGFDAATTEAAAAERNTLAIELGSHGESGLEAAPAADEPVPPVPEWGDERDSVLDAASFEAFMRRFSDLDKELRETDVFYVSAEVAPPRALSEGRVRRIETAEVLAGYADVGAVVDDVTRLAKQATKAIYQDTLRKSEEGIF